MEFVLKSAKVVDSMKDLTESEVKLFQQYLPKDCGPVDNFFEGNDWTTYHFQVIYWEWRGQTLIDMNGWPGDNEDGAIFLNGKVVAKNGDQDLHSTDDTPAELRELLDDLQHVRGFDCFEHPQCCEYYKRYKQCVPGGNLCLYKLNGWHWTPEDYTYPLEVTTNSEGQEIVTLNGTVILINDQPTKDCPFLFLLDLESYLHIKTFSCQEVGHIYCRGVLEEYQQLKSQ